jgi:hypothetical protein
MTISFLVMGIEILRGRYMLEIIPGKPVQIPGNRKGAAF